MPLGEFKFCDTCGQQFQAGPEDNDTCLDCIYCIVTHSVPDEDEPLEDEEEDEDRCDVCDEYISCCVCDKEDEDCDPEDDLWDTEGIVAVEHETPEMRAENVSHVYCRDCRDHCPSASCNDETLLQLEEIGPDATCWYCRRRFHSDDKGGNQ